MRDDPFLPLTGGPVTVDAPLAPQPRRHSLLTATHRRVAVFCDPFGHHWFLNQPAD